MLVTAYQGNGKEKKILVFRADLSKMAWVRVFYMHLHLVDVQRETARARALQVGCLCFIAVKS